MPSLCRTAVWRQLLPIFRPTVRDLGHVTKGVCMQTGSAHSGAWAFPDNDPVPSLPSSYQLTSCQSLTICRPTANTTTMPMHYSSEQGVNCRSMQLGACGGGPVARFHSASRFCFRRPRCCERTMRGRMPRIQDRPPCNMGARMVGAPKTQLNALAEPTELGELNELG